jgi:hypothetical protein
MSISSAVSDVTELTGLAFATWNLLQFVPSLWNVLRTKNTGLYIITPHYVFVNHIITNMYGSHSC